MGFNSGFKVLIYLKSVNIYQSNSRNVSEDLYIQITFVNNNFFHVSDARYYAEGVAESVGRLPDQRSMNEGASEEEQHWYCHLRFCVILQNSIFVVVYCVCEHVKIR